MAPYEAVESFIFILSLTGWVASGGPLRTVAFLFSSMISTCTSVPGFAAMAGMYPKANP